MADDWAPVAAAPQDDWAPVAAPEPQEERQPRGFIDRVVTGMRAVPVLGMQTMAKDVADVFMEGVEQTVNAPGQITGRGPNEYAELGVNIQKKLLEAGASEQEAKREGDRLARTLQRNEGILGLGMGPMMAISAPLFGPFRSLVSKPIEEMTGFPHEATEQYAQVAAATVGLARMPHKVARVRVEPDGKVHADVVGEVPKDADFKTSAELLSDRAPMPDPLDIQQYADVIAENAMKNAAGNRSKAISALEGEAKAQNLKGTAEDTPFLRAIETLKRAGEAEATEANLRRLWDEDGIHPAEAVQDARNDAFLRHDLTGEAAKPDPAFPPERVARILAGEEEAEIPLRAVGAEVTSEAPLTPLSQQPAQPPGRLMTAAHDALDRLFDLGRDLQMKLAPMATGTRDSMATAKDFANSLRRNRWEWSRVDDDIAKRFDPEQRKRMFNAMDEESVALQTGESREHQGLATLTPEERAAVIDLDDRQQLAWLRALDLGMVQGEGIPMHAPRMVLNVANARKEGAMPLNGLGRNLRVKTPGMRHRAYLTVEETEAAAKKALGEEAVVARDIRAVALSTAQLEDAITGRTLVNAIQDQGKRTGAETVAEGFKPDNTWFTLDHPALKTWRPKFETVDGKTAAVKDASGNTVFEQIPIYIRGDFEGPLRATLDHRSGAIYGAMMSLKGKTMSLIMNSPMIHNAVEWGRAVPALPGKVATFKVYFEGNRAKNDVPVMREAIDAGLVPIGKRFFNQDITGIMESPDLTPGRSWTAKVLGFVPGLFDEGAGVAVKRAIDKAGDFWHNTLLWDRIADLQMGLYTNFQADLIAKGVDRQTASRAAAHWANRYAGALPQEAMSDSARKVGNMLLFSRSFTLGNLGVMKDMLTGLPKDVLAQIERDAGFRAGAIEAAEPGAPGEVAAFAKTMARRKAMAVVALDIGLMYVMNSLLQNTMNVMVGDSTLDAEMHGYAERLKQALSERAENPMKLLQPFAFFHEISATHENEPGRQDRVKVGYTKDGTAIYARNPVGKIGEEFEGYLTGPLDMIRRKLGTIARPAWTIMANDAGFGRKVYDPGADTPAKYLANLGKIAAHLVKSQLPEGQITAASDMVKGEGDPKLAALQTFGPIAGATFSKGAPGGPAVGEMYAAKTQHQYAVDAALPDIRKQIQRGDVAGAQDRMTELGIAPGLQRFYVRTSLNPATRLSGRTLRDFYLYATPEQRGRLENAR